MMKTPPLSGTANPMTDTLPTDNRIALRRVARACRKAALATLLDGLPYASLVTVAFDHDLSPILLLSRLADHTRNLLVDGRASLLLEGTDGHANPQTGPRVTLMGSMTEDEEPRLRRRFLGRHPAAAMYAGFGDFSIWRLTIQRAHFVGGFARAVWFDAPLGLAASAAASLAEAEPALLDWVNTGEHAGALDHLVRQQAGGDGEGWQLAGIDPDGCDVIRGEDVCRLAFDQPMDSAQAAREGMAALMVRGSHTPIG
jgi:putative heme iron utilization protein